MAHGRRLLWPSRGSWGGSGERAAAGGVSHLLAADDALIPGRWGVHITLCGQQVRGPNVEHDDPLDLPDFRYCPQCVAEAARWNAEAGRADHASADARVTELDETCPACRSGQTIRQTSRTPRVQAWACDRCDTSYAISVVNPRPFLDRIAAAVAERSIADQVLTLAPDPSAQAAQGDDSEPTGYYVAECGHRVPGGPIFRFRAGPCEDCDPSTT